MIKRGCLISLFLITFINHILTLQPPMSCSYGLRGSLTSTCYYAKPEFFRKTTYRFDNLDETVRCVNCSLQVIETATFDISRNQIKYLDLSNSKIVVLKEKAFIGLIYLRKLNLKDNQINGVPRGTFQGITKIEELNIENNSITSLTANGFQELSNLKILNLKNNHIKNIDNGSFNGLATLEELDLANNNIGIIDNIFQGLSNIRSINLEGNSLETLPLLDVQQLDEFLVLNLAKNVLKTLQNNTFLQLPRLETLNISDNKISMIEIGAFRGLNSLEQLDLSRCRIEDVPKGLLGALHQLRVLNLDFNLLSDFKTGAFSGLPELRKLNLSHNSIKTYMKTSVFSLHNLHSLDLSFNNLDDLDYMMLVHHLPALSFLGLRNNSLPCYLEKEIQETFVHDNLILDILGDVDDSACNYSRSVIVETPEEAFALRSPDNRNDYVLYFLVTCSFVLITVLFYVQYRNKRTLDKIFGKSNMSETQLISQALEEGDNY